MNTQKIQLNQMLLCLCSLFLILGLCTGCQKQDSYISIHDFYELVDTAYSLEQVAEDNPAPMPFDDAIALLEDLSESKLITSLKGPYLTKEEAQELIDLSVHLFLEQKQEGNSEIQYKDFKDITLEVNKLEGNRLESNLNLEIGEIVVVHEFAYKIVEKQDDYYLIEEASIDELCSDISIHEDIEVKPSQIQLEEGVALSYATPTSSALNMTMEINFSKDQLELSSDFGKLLGMDSSIKIGKESRIIHTSEFEHLSIIPSRLEFEKIVEENKNIPIELKDHKYKKGYEITGSISLSNLILHPSIEIHQGHVDALGMDLSYECQTKLKYKGVISEDIKLASILVPIGTTGAKLNVGLYLNLAANGEVELSLKNASHTKVSYCNDTLKKICTKTTTITSDGAIKLLVGPKFDMVLQIYGITISNFDLLIQAELKNDAFFKLKQEKDDLELKHQLLFDYSCNLYGPIVTLKLGTRKSLANRLGIVFDGKIVNEKNSFHYPIYKDQILIFEWNQPLEKQVIEKERLNLENYTYHLYLDESSTIAFSKIPSDLNPKDIIYQVEDPNIVEIKEQKIIPKKIGTTSLLIYDPNHEYQIECSIHVMDRKMEEFNQL